MTRQTKPELLSDETLAEIAEMFPHAEYQPEVEDMPLCKFCNGAIDDHKANCVVPHVHALIQTVRALRGQVDEWELHREGIIEAVKTAETQAEKLEEANAVLRDQLAALKYGGQEFRRIAEGEITRLREQLAQAQSERNEARQKFMRRCTHPNTSPLKEATRRCHDCGAEILL